MFEALLVVAVLLGIALPHFLPLHAVAPRTAVTVWLSALALRALVALAMAAFIFLYVPQTDTFGAVADWCWSLVSHHLGLSGHPLAHAAVILPALAIAGSLLWVLFGLVRGALALRLLLARRSLGEGPYGSMVVHGDEILVAVTGVGRARVVISHSALGAMDREELEASVAHELGHIRRRHRPLLLIGSAFKGLGRLLPGTGAAERELSFHLERDADEYAVRSTQAPLALASAICKASTAREGSAVLPALGGSGRVSLRLDYLVGARRPAGVLLERSTRVLAALTASLVLALGGTLPAWATASAEQAVQADATLTASCPHG